jgi:flagellin-like protein
MKLFEQDDERGQVGIGTLIIFIALVLVAAVAAGVLISTAGDLESRASDTGEDAQAEVSNQIQVVSATGVAVDNSSGVEELRLVVKKSAGSDPIDMADATIQYESGAASETLTQSPNGTANGTTFSTTDATGGSDATVLDDTSDRIEITVDASTIEGGNDLDEGSSVTLELVDQSGATTVYGVNIPDVLTEDYVKV